MTTRNISSAVPVWRRFRPHGGVWFGATLLVLAVVPVPAADFGAIARDWHTRLCEKILPYWHDTALDTEHGGYLLADDLKGRGVAREKQLVSQSRMVWTFAHVHRHGYRDPARDYLKAAGQGYRFLRTHFLDPDHGGYFWKTDLAGQPVHDCKFLYGQAFVVYAFVEYYRASGDRGALEGAMDLYRDIQRRLHDRENGGWFEHAGRDWQLLAPGDPRGQVEVVGYKSANAHLHWMEALAELYDASRDAAVRQSLEEVLRLNRDYFYPADPGRSCFHRRRDWQPVTDPASAGLSYGHNVEFAWLMLRAEQVLGQTLSWAHFRAHLDHALKHGYDHERGGLYNRGTGDQPASQTDKIWWVQSEMLAALTDALAHQPRAEYTLALEQLLRFVDNHLTDPKDGVWIDTVTAEGRPKSTAKAHSWKANYHDVRALVKFVNTFYRTIKQG